MKKQTFIAGTIILTIGGFIAKIIGAFYKIPLTNILGSAGMGIYYLVFPLYNLMFIFSSSGISVAITKLIAEARVNKVKKNETTYLKAGLLIGFVVSFLFAIIMAVFAEKIAYSQGNILSKLGFVAIAPSIIFASLVTIIKGYFQGIENMIPSSIAIIVEQIVKLIAGLIFSYKLLPYGIEYAVMGSIIAVTISEGFTFFIMIVNYLYHKKYRDNRFYNKDNNNLLKQINIESTIKNNNKYKKTKIAINKKIFYFHRSSKYISFLDAIKSITRMMVPNTLISLVLPLISLFDSFLVINLLTKTGYSSLTATSLYGINSGVVASLISLPVIITSSVATAIVPNLSGLVCSNNKNEVNERVSFFIKITFVVVLPIFLFFAIFSSDIISALYNFGTNVVINEYGFACKLLFVSSVIILYNALLSTFVSILQSINKTYTTFFIMGIAFVVRSIITIVLLQNLKFNIFGLVVSQVVFLLICDIGCLMVIKKNIEIKTKVFQSYFLPCLSLAISSIVSYLTSQIFENINIWLSLVVSGGILTITYLVFLFVFRCFDDVDTKYIPILRRFRRIRK